MAEQLSSDIVPIEEEPLCLEEDTSEAHFNASNIKLSLPWLTNQIQEVELTAKEYITRHDVQSHQLHAGDFASLQPGQKYEVLRETDE